MKKETYTNRMSRVLEAMEKQGIDCFFAGPSATMRYLCGYSGKGDERLLFLVLAPGKKPFIIANKLYELQVCTAPVEEFVYWLDGEDAAGLLMKELRKREISVDTVAIDPTMPGRFFVPIMQQIPGSHMILGNGLVDPLRIYKDIEEMEYMAQACRWASAALENTISRGTWWIGKTEADFKDELCRQMTKQGLIAHGGVVAVGANAAVPHHITGQSVIEEGKCLLVDFSGNYEGYWSDMTRTFHFGEPTDEFKQVYEIVREANRRGKEAAKIGNYLQDVDRAARGYIESCGYGEYFTHRTGHGIGLEGHEGPSAAEGVEVPIVPGMCFSVEPGIYLPGKFGVRIEDQVQIREDGRHVLHDVPRELRIIR